MFDIDDCTLEELYTYFLESYDKHEKDAHEKDEQESEQS